MSCLALILILLLAGAADGLMDIGIGCFIATGAIVMVISALLIWADNNFYIGRRKHKNEEAQDHVNK